MQNEKLRSKKQNIDEAMPYIPLAKLIGDSVPVPSSESCRENGVDEPSFIAGIEWLRAYAVALPSVDVVESEKRKKINAMEIEPEAVLEAYGELFGFADDDDCDCCGACESRADHEQDDEEDDIDRLLSDLDAAIDSQYEYLMDSGEKVADILAEAAYAIRAFRGH